MRLVCSPSAAGPLPPLHPEAPNAAILSLLIAAHGTVRRVPCPHCSPTRRVRRAPCFHCGPRRRVWRPATENAPFCNRDRRVRRPSSRSSGASPDADLPTCSFAPASFHGAPHADGRTPHSAALPAKRGVFDGRPPHSASQSATNGAASDDCPMIVTILVAAKIGCAMFTLLAPGQSGGLI